MMRIFFILTILIFSVGFTKQADNQTTTIKVYGNESCKTDIEELILTLNGVSAASWDAKTKLMKIEYDESKTSRHDFFFVLAEAGYDNQGLRAKVDNYKKLSTNCKYERSVLED